MSHIIQWTIYLVVAVLIIAATVATLSIAGAWIQPRLKQMTQGIKPVKGHLPCCPPGLGCNDPDKARRMCYRREAAKIGTVDELIEMDGAWAVYSGIPPRNSRKRAEALATFAEVRDRIIANALKDNADRLNGRHGGRRALPAHVEERDKVHATGEVM